MMVNIKIAEVRENVLRYLPAGGIIGVVFLLEIFFIVDNDYIPISPTQLSTTYLTDTVYAEELQGWTNLENIRQSTLYHLSCSAAKVSGLILLAAMIGARVLTTHKTTQVKRQDVFRQNAVDSKNAIKKIRDIRGLQLSEAIKKRTKKIRIHVIFFCTLVFFFTVPFQSLLFFRTKQSKRANPRKANVFRDESPS